MTVAIIPTRGTSMQEVQRYFEIIQREAAHTGKLPTVSVAKALTGRDWQSQNTMHKRLMEAGRIKIEWIGNDRFVTILDTTPVWVAPEKPAAPPVQCKDLYPLCRPCGRRPSPLERRACKIGSRHCREVS